MLTTKRVLALVIGFLGVALIAKGVWNGLWPLSYQLFAGVLLVIFAFLRWRSL